MFCAKCGNNLETGVSFCNKCGAKIEGTINNPPTNAPNNAPNAGTSANSGNLIMGLHKQRAAILLACIIGTLSMFLPWATSYILWSSVTWNAFQFENNAIGGFIALLFFAIPIFTVLRGDRSGELTKKDKNTCLWDGIIGVGYGIWFITHINGLIWQTRVREGLFLMMLASAAVAVCAFFPELKNKFTKIT